MDKTPDARDTLPTLIDAWYIAQCRNPYAHYYVYVKPAPAAALAIAEDAPEGYELASQQRVSPAWTKEAALSILLSQSGQWPVIG